MKKKTEENIITSQQFFKLHIITYIYIILYFWILSVLTNLTYHGPQRDKLKHSSNVVENCFRILRSLLILDRCDQVFSEHELNILVETVLCFSAKNIIFMYLPLKIHLWMHNLGCLTKSFHKSPNQKLQMLTQDLHSKWTYTSPAVQIC